MTTLRHPHVVLFMAASIKPPKMCIVMEYMSLGSLYDVRTPTHHAAETAHGRNDVRLGLTLSCVCACACGCSSCTTS
jgi:hypothetical protein